MVETFDSWVRELGQLGYLVLALAALIEYLAPPFPGDTVVLLGGAYAVRSHNSVLLVWLAVNATSALGIAANYAVGRFVADHTRLTPGKKLLFGVTHQSVIDLQVKMREKGAWLLVANRFLPSFRTVLFIAAGAARMPLEKVLLLGMASAMAWNGLLLGAGYLMGGNAERLEALLRDYKLVAFAVLGVVAVFFLVRWLLQKKSPNEVRSP